MPLEEHPQPPQDDPAGEPGRPSPMVSPFPRGLKKGDGAFYWGLPGRRQAVIGSAPFRHPPETQALQQSRALVFLRPPPPPLRTPCRVSLQLAWARSRRVRVSKNLAAAAAASASASPRLPPQPLPLLPSPPLPPWGQHGAPKLPPFSCALSGQSPRGPVMVYGARGASTEVTGRGKDG